MARVSFWIPEETIKKTGISYEEVYYTRSGISQCLFHRSLGASVTQIWLMLSFQAIKAAVANPVTSLRSE